MNQNYFKVGGSIPVDNPSYIKRKADQELYNNLKQGEFCYVLTARQMGKSSLKVRTMAKLAQEGWLNADVDLTQIGTSDSIEQWYFSFLSQISDTLQMDELFEDWWETKDKLTPVAKMGAFWNEILLSNTVKPIVIFIDEVDAVLSQQKKNFSTDDFFAAIRAAYNKRGSYPAFQRLNFCVFGVASPNDLMNDHKRTPFNIGLSVQLENFTFQETQPLIKGFTDVQAQGKKLLEQILSWTAGQPYLTQKVCQALTKYNSTQPNIDDLVEQLFFSETASNDPHFVNIENRLLKAEDFKLRMLEGYQKMLQQGSIPIDRKATEQIYLKLSGVAKAEGNQLVITNRIYQKIFDSTWLDRAFNSINRPFSLDLKRWLENNRSIDTLLKGGILENAEKWASGRDDLSNAERDFLQASRTHEMNEEREKQIRTEKEKGRKSLLIVLLLLIIALVSTIIIGIRNNNLVLLTNEQKEELLKSKEELNTFQHQANAEKKKAEEQKRIADSLKIASSKITDTIIIGQQKLDSLQNQIAEMENRLEESEREIVRVNRNNLENLISKVYDFIASNDIDLAIDSLSKALEIDSTDIRVIQLKEEIDKRTKS